MAITRPKPKTVDEFITSAPDAGRKGVRKGKKEQISLTISPELLARIDAICVKLGQSRAGMINLAIYQYAEREDRGQGG